MKIPVYIIGERNSVRNPELLNMGNLGFELHFQSPIFFEDESRAIFKSSSNLFRAMYFRDATLGELGCAMSHMLVQEKIVSDNCSSIVLEDDAYVLDIEELKNIHQEFISLNLSEPALLNLATTEPFNENTNSQRNRVASIVRNWGPSPLACGYILNPKAALALSQINKNLDFKADWPPLKMHYCRSSIPLIAHGTVKTSSLIENISRRSKVNIFQKIAVYSCLRYFSHRSVFGTFRRYLTFMIIPRIKDKMNMLSKLIHRS